MDKGAMKHLNIKMPKLNLNIDFYYVFIIMIWAESILAQYVRAVVMRIPVINANNGYPVIYAIYILAFMIALPQLLRYQRGIKIIIPLIISFVYLITYLLFPQNTEQLNMNAFAFFVTVLPMMSLGFAWDIDKVIDPLYIVSLLTVFFAILYSIFIGDSLVSSGTAGAGAMDFAYKLLPHVCLVGYYALKKTNIVNVALAVAGSVFLFSLGTRGAVLCLLVFFALVCLFLLNGKKRIFFVSLASVSAVLLFTGNVLFDLLDFLEPIFKKFGLSLRIIEKIRDDVLFDSKGRDIIREKLLASLKDHEFWGYGLFGDRLVAGDYAHNLIIELMIDFGIVMGIAILVALLVLILRRLIKCHNTDQRAFILLLVCSTVVKMMLTGSYLTESYFFLLIGICLTDKFSTSNQNPLEISKDALKP